MALSSRDLRQLDTEGRLHFTKAGGIRLKRYLDETKGVVLQCLWDDISPINSRAKERLGYPTQKPLALLERIIKASINEGDVVLDPFCGCGTAVDAAQCSGRRWIGIDVTHIAVSLIRRRLRDRWTTFLLRLLESQRTEEARGLSPSKTAINSNPGLWTR